jgi:hypothetical protein
MLSEADQAVDEGVAIVAAPVARERQPIYMYEMMERLIGSVRSAFLPECRYLL